MAIKISGTTVVDDSRNLTNINDATLGGTGYLKLPAGTTAQRPGSPSAGMIRYNTSTGETELYDGSTWTALGASLIAFDGTVQSSYTFNEVSSVSEYLTATSAFTGTSGITYAVASGSLPGGLSLNTSNGTLSGTTAELVSTTAYTATITADDGINTASKTITFTVNADNDAPTWNTGADLGVATGGAYSRTLSASDPEGQSLTYSLAGGSSLPPNTTLSSAGVLSGTSSTSGVSYSFTINVSDGTNSVSRTFSLLYGYPTVGSDGQTYSSGTIINSGTGVWYYNNTTSNQSYTFTVPTGVSNVNVLAVGGGGGSGNTGPGPGAGGGGGGGGAIGNYSVSGGQGYSVQVGRKGQSEQNGGASSFGPFITGNGGTRSNAYTAPSNSYAQGGTGSGGTHLNKSGGDGGSHSGQRDDSTSYSAQSGYTGGGGRSGSSGGSGQNSFGGGGGGGASNAWRTLTSMANGTGGSGGPQGYAGGRGGFGYASSGTNGSGPAGGSGSSGSCDPRGCDHATTNQGGGGGGSFGGGAGGGGGWYSGSPQGGGGVVVINWGTTQYTS